MSSLLISGVFAAGFGFALSVQAWTWATIAFAGWLITVSVLRRLENEQPRDTNEPSDAQAVVPTAAEWTAPRISLEKLKDITNAINVLISAVDSEERFVYANQAHHDLDRHPGRSLVGMTLRENLGPVAYEIIAPYVAKALSGERVRFETTIPSSEMGQELYFVSTYVPRVDVDGTVDGFYVLSENLTDQRAAEFERQALEKRMMQSQKLESLGVLAGGIAHDFNNLLASMMAGAGLVRRGLQAAKDVDDDIEQIELAAQSASDLCRQMLEFAGKGNNEEVALELPVLIREMQELLEVSVLPSVTLEFDLAEVSKPIRGDTGQLRGAIFTLITNASEAMSGRSGSITVRTSESVLDREALSQTYLDDELPAGPYAVLEVTDEGCGMTDDVIASVFDPFFSTKFTGRGLGLASTLGIVRSHHGAIDVQSEPEVGTRIRIALPLLAERALEPVRKPPTPVDDWQGGGTVLVVDDDSRVRRASKRILEGCGLKALTAESGTATLDLLRKRAPHSIDLIVLDLTMPVMDGAQTLAEIRKLDPDVKVLLCSGYSEAEVKERCRGLDYAGILPKPFGFNAFASRVRDLLEDETD